MKFFSTYQNYRVILEPGQPGNRALGTHSKSATSVKFEGGVADVDKPVNGHTADEIIAMMKAHPSYESDFISDESSSEDPYNYKRRDVEPKHTVAEVKYGNVSGSQNAGRISSPEKEKAFKDAVKAEALKLVQSMLAEQTEDSKETELSNEQTTKLSNLKKGDNSPLNSRLTAPEPLEDDESTFKENKVKVDEQPPVASDEVIEESVSNTIDELIPSAPDTEQEAKEDVKDETPKKDANKVTETKNPASKKK